MNDFGDIVRAGYNHFFKLDCKKTYERELAAGRLKDTQYEPVAADAVNAKSRNAEIIDEYANSCSAEFRTDTERLARLEAFIEAFKTNDQLKNMALTLKIAIAANVMRETNGFKTSYSYAKGWLHYTAQLHDASFDSYQNGLADDVEDLDNTEAQIQALVYYIQEKMGAEALTQEDSIDLIQSPYTVLEYSIDEAMGTYYKFTEAVAPGNEDERTAPVDTQREWTVWYMLQQLEECLTK